MCVNVVVVVGKLNVTTVRTTDSSRRRVIQLLVNSALNVTQLAGSDQSLSVSEGYVLEVLSARQRVVVTGVTAAGVFYGLQSLLGFLVQTTDKWTLPAVCQPRS